MKIRKLRNVVLIAPDTYNCSVEIFNESENVWNKILYVSRKEDNSPVNQWILNEISTGKYKINS